MLKNLGNKNLLRQDLVWQYHLYIIEVDQFLF